MFFVPIHCVPRFYLVYVVFPCYYDVSVFPKGPSLRLWYGLLDKFFPTTGKKLAYKKVLLDQLVFAPSAIVVVVSLTNAINGSSVPQIRAKLRQDYLDILMANYKLWPAVMVLNFSLVPLQYQVLVTQVVAIVWNTYFSWKANQPILQPSPS